MTDSPALRRNAVSPLDALEAAAAAAAAFAEEGGADECSPEEPAAAAPPSPAQRSGYGRYRGGGRAAEEAERSESEGELELRSPARAAGRGGRPGSRGRGPRPGQRPPPSGRRRFHGPGRLGTVARPQRLPMTIRFVWGFCMRAQGA